MNEGKQEVSAQEIKSSYALVQKDIAQQEKAATAQSINDELPVELLTYIFCFLSTKDIRNVELTCQLWKVVSQSNPIWQNLALRDFSIDSEKLSTAQINWQKNYVQAVRYERMQKRKVILINEKAEPELVIHNFNKLQEDLANAGAEATPLIISPRCGGITAISTLTCIGLGFIVAPYIKLPAWAVVSFFGIIGCNSGSVGGTYYEQKRNEGKIARTQSEISQIDNEETPLLRPKSISMEQ